MFSANGGPTLVERALQHCCLTANEHSTRESHRDALSGGNLPSLHELEECIFFIIDFDLGFASKIQRV